MRRNYQKFVDEFLTKTGMTGADMARAIGVTPDTIQGLRRGSITSPQHTTKKKINQFVLNYRKKNQLMAELQTKHQTTDIVGIDSRTVAEWTNKKHKELMRDIRQYSEYLKGADLRCTDFWQETTYTASNGKENPCYMITKKGCEFIQHKMTGQKGAVFTAKYINYFWEQGEQLQEATQILLDLENQPATQTLLGISDLSYIKNKLAELVDMDSLSDINNGLERVKRLVEVIGGTQ